MFRRVVLLLLGSLPERFQLLEDGYRPFFLDVIHLIWLNEREEREMGAVALARLGDHEFAANDAASEQRGETAFAEEAAASATTRAGRTVFSCGRRFRLVYHSECLWEILQHLERKYGRASPGVFVCHEDFWFHPLDIARGLSGPWARDLWRFGPGLASNGRSGTPGHKCFKSMIEVLHDTEYSGWPAMREESWACTLAAYHGMGYRKGNPTRGPEVCVGWVDAYYLPRTAWASLGKMLPKFKDIQYEVALPTIFNYIAKFEQHRQRMESRCWSGTGILRNPSDLQHQVCGCRMDIKEPAMQEAWLTLMQSASSSLQSERTWEVGMGETVEWS